MASTNDNTETEELEVPAWLDAEFLIKVLHNCEGNCNELELKSFKISAATGKGEHYASIIFRVKVEYSNAGVDKSRSLIVKAMPEVDSHMKGWFGDSNIFEIEIGMYLYTEVLPRFEQILRDAGDETMLKAYCLYHQLSPRKVIVFEDIVPKGYEVVRCSLNEEEVKAVFVKLAKMQAVSYKISLEEPKYLEQYRDNIFTMPTITSDPFITDGIKNFIATYKSEPILGKYIPYFEKVQTEFLKRCQDCFFEYRKAPQPDGCYVLCHGDLNMRNMMFKRDASSGKLVDVMLIDFQVCYVGAIVLDLINAKCFLLDKKMREDWPSYLNIYLTQFNETLEKIGYEGPLPTIYRMHELMMRHKFYELFIIVTFLPQWFAIHDGHNDITERLTSPDFHKNVYKNKNLIAELERILPKYEKWGYFEDN